MPSGNERKDLKLPSQSVSPCSSPVKHSGNLSTRSLVGIVKKEDIVQDSEYLETLIVAVPKYVLSNARV